MCHKVTINQTEISFSSSRPITNLSFISRFRGMISTQPGSTPSSSFKIVSLEDDNPGNISSHGNEIGPFGDQDDEQVLSVEQNFSERFMDLL